MSNLVNTKDLHMSSLISKSLAYTFYLKVKAKKGFLTREDVGGKVSNETMMSKFYFSVTNAVEPINKKITEASSGSSPTGVYKTYDHE